MTSRTVVEAAALSVARAGGTPADNEDSVKFESGKGNPEAWADFVAVVADGVGTSREPQKASLAAVETWTQFLERRFSERPEDLAAFDESQFGHLLRECFAQSHRQVGRIAPGGSATAAGVCVQGPWLLAATVGDARVYHFTGGTLRQLTEDQVDALGNPTDVLGGRAATPAAASYASPNLSPGDWIVACSDGVSKTVSPEDLAALLRSFETPQSAVKALKERVQVKGVDDDVTAVFARVTRVGTPFWAGIGGWGLGTELPDGEDSPITHSSSKSSHSQPFALTPTSPAPSPQEDPDDMALTDLEKRMERLERMPNGGTLSQQENSRLQREFDRLEEGIRELEARTSRLSGMPVWWAVAALIVGLGLGALLPGAVGWTGMGKASGLGVEDGADSPAGVALKIPGDFGGSLEYRLTDTAMVLRYRTKAGGQKVAVYPFRADGKPSVTYALPAEDSAPKRGTTESERVGESNSSRRSSSRRSPE